VFGTLGFYRVRTTRSKLGLQIACLLESRLTRSKLCLVFGTLGLYRVTNGPLQSLSSDHLAFFRVANDPLQVLSPDRLVFLRSRTTCSKLCLRTAWLSLGSPTNSPLQALPQDRSSFRVANDSLQAWSSDRLPLFKVTNERPAPSLVFRSPVF
jgi:hypothetical protein